MIALLNEGSYELVNLLWDHSLVAERWLSMIEVMDFNFCAKTGKRLGVYVWMVEWVGAMMDLISL
jgi:hypothetical protein